MKRSVPGLVLVSGLRVDRHRAIARAARSGSRPSGRRGESGTETTKPKRHALSSSHSPPRVHPKPLRKTPCPRFAPSSAHSRVKRSSVVPSWCWLWPGRALCSVASQKPPRALCAQPAKTQHCVAERPEGRLHAALHALGAHRVEHPVKTLPRRRARRHSCAPSHSPGLRGCPSRRSTRSAGA